MCWAGYGVAAVFLALSVAALLDEPEIAWFTLPVALLSALFGRACRYVLAGK
jgi:hypothetical protein